MLNSGALSVAFKVLESSTRYGWTSQKMNILLYTNTSFSKLCGNPNLKVSTGLKKTQIQWHLADTNVTW